MRCRGCGGELGRDCWNEQDCMWITADMAARAHMPQPPAPCQGCSEVTRQMRECIGVCDGLTCWEDVEARGAAWRKMLATTAYPADPHDHRDDATAIGDSTGYGGPVGGGGRG